MDEREIDRKVAELEGLTDPSFSPTTCWEDCGPLIQKYGVNVDGFAGKAWIGRKAIPSENILVAICLAILYKDDEEYKHI